MKRSFVGTYKPSLFGKAIILCLSFAFALATIRPGEAANLTVQQASFSPSSVQIGQTFTFSFNLNSSIVVSNAIVTLDIKNAGGTLLLQKNFSGQNFQAGQTTSYSWNGTIPTGTTFTAGTSYNMIVYVFNSGYTAQYTPAVTAATFVATNTPNVGYTAIAPIQPPAGTGKTYYVSDPSNTTVDKANRALLPAGATIYSTIQAAADVTQPGDTVLVMNGTYTSNPAAWVYGVLTVNTSGTAAGGYITYAAYPGAHPIISTFNNTNTSDVIEILASYIVIKGFEVVGDAQNITLAQANQTTATETALLQQEAAAGQPATFPVSTAERAANGNCVDGSNITHIFIMNNIIHDCSSDGLGFGTSDYITMEANTVYNNSWWSMYDTSGIGLHYALNSDSSTGYKNYVLDNISYNNANTQPYLYNVYKNFVTPGSAQTAPTDGNGINIDTNQSSNDGTPYLGRTLVAGNITYGNGASGIHAYLSNHVDMINNTAYMNDTCPVSGSTCGPAATTVNGVTISGINNGQIYSLSGTDNNLYNNIMYAPAGKAITENYGNTNVAENYNILYSANGQIILDGYKLGAQDIASDPLFSNASSPSSNEFLFSSNSPGINKGTNYTNVGVSVPTLLGLTITNGAVNIGADQ